MDLEIAKGKVNRLQEDATSTGYSLYLQGHMLIDRAKGGGSLDDIEIIGLGHILCALSDTMCNATANAEDGIETLVNLAEAA
jgi:hypothetical protein